MALTQTPQIITDLDADCGIIVDFDGNLLSVAPQCVRRRIVDGVWGEDYSDFAIDNASFAELLSILMEIFYLSPPNVCDDASSMAFGAKIILILR